jgi:hypothetical protein
MAQLHITGLYAFRRPIRAAPGFRPARSVAWFLPTPALTHSLSALRLLRKRLSGPPNRRIQPERYATFVLKILVKNIQIFQNIIDTYFKT